MTSATSRSLEYPAIAGYAGRIDDSQATCCQDCLIQFMR
jgi:hypothetical protein